jgi:acyl dehydratase
VRPGDTIHTEVEVISRRESRDSSRGIVTFRDHVTNRDGVEVFHVNMVTPVVRRG